MAFYMGERSAKRWLEKFTERMAAEHGVRVSVEFHNGGLSSHRTRGTLHRIRYGMRGAVRYMAFGFTDYATIDWLWQRKCRGAPVGDPLHDDRKGLWGLAIHEFAHAIQLFRGYRSVHNNSFARALLDLMQMYPFGEICGRTAVLAQREMFQQDPVAVAAARGLVPYTGTAPRTVLFARTPWRQGTLL